jgi:Tripartite tricarboxylate transporter family receptor
MFPRVLGPALTALAGVLLLSVLPAEAKSDASYFRHKTIDYIVATSAGGSYNFYGRLIARHMSEYLPGSHIVVRNVPGANHGTGAETIYRAAPDGLTIGSFSPALIYSQLVGRTQFDLDSMSWIGNAGADSRILVVSVNSPIRTIADLHQPGDTFYFGVSRVGSVNYNETRILQDVLDFNAQIIIGYKSNDDERALQDHSIDAVFGPRSLYQPFVDKGFGKAIFQIGGERNGVPHLVDLLKDGNGDVRDVIALMQSQANLAHLTAGPPGIPMQRLALLRAAYLKAVTDPRAKMEAAAAGYDLTSYAVGDDVANAVSHALDQSPKTIEAVARTFSVPTPTQIAKARRNKLLQ